MDAPLERRHRSVGRDHLLIEAERLLIRSPVDMLDWQVREFRRLKVRHDGRDWDLVAKLPGAAGTVRYELVPWPEERRDLPGALVTYDEDYVGRRDEELEGEHRRDRAGVAGVLLLPLIGLLPARVKLRLEERGYGSALRATRLSRLACWAVLLLGGAASTVLMFGGGLGRSAAMFELGGLVGLLGLPLGLDVLARWSRAQEDPLDVAGFLEWAWTRRTSAALDSKHGATPTPRRSTAPGE